MAVSMREVDPAFQGAGQKAGIEVWKIENSKPVAIPEASYGKFFTGDSYIILKTVTKKSGVFRYEIHYWLGKDATEDDASTAATKTLELDAALGGRAVQYRELQAHETERFLSLFKPCIIPEESEPQEHKTRMFVCKGKHVVHVYEVPCARSSLNHEDICILDTKKKIFQFNGSNTSIQERAKALEVVQYIKTTYHTNKCDIATIDDGRLMADAEAGEFWGFFGGFAPLPKKTATNDAQSTHAYPTQLLCIIKGKAIPVAADSLTKKLLDTHHCYLLDCGTEIYVWVGRSTNLEERKAANGAAEEHLRVHERPKSNIIRMIENFETVSFRSKFDSWPPLSDVVASEDGRGKVAALLKRRGLDVKGLIKTSTEHEEEPQPYIDCSGNLQVWRVDGKEKSLLPDIEQSKFYTGDCYIFQYTYSGDEQEECLMGTWFGKQSVKEDRDSTMLLITKMLESVKFLATQARVYEGDEPFLFYAIFQSFMVLKGGLSKGYKNYISEKGLPDDTYREDGIGLFRVQGSGPENMQSIQVDPVAASLNSSYCFILHKDTLVFMWNGNQTTTEDHELSERQLDLIKPDMQTRVHKEGAESDQFWEILGGKTKHPNQKIQTTAETDPHLFSCTLSKDDNLKLYQIHNFKQDDLLTEDVYIIDVLSSIFIWVGQQVEAKTKTQKLAIGEKFLERDIRLEKLSLQTPIFIITEGSEPPFFTRFFTWDSKKTGMHGNSFERRLSLIKDGGRSTMNLKPKKRAPVSFGGRSGSEKPQRSRSVSFGSDRPRARGRSPAFNALASKFDNPTAQRNLSTPPPVVNKLFPKVGGGGDTGGGGGGGNLDTSKLPGRLDTSKLFSKSKAIASLTASFDKPTRDKLMPRSIKTARSEPVSKMEANAKGTPMSSRKIGGLGVNKEDANENKVEKEEEEKGGTFYPYDRLTTSSTDPAPNIDVAKREMYLSSSDFREKFGMTKDAFYKMPKWKQNKMKISLKMF
ncbi:villin-4 isoform X1 [Lactuca sativa]|uniref:villin-4 isoform X1 n=1 Tax=Lactuca sativa TaxID=4236 RepID=UPI000CD8D63C|nr:villin-4 isoform X1 [Lactuca sativa]